MSWSCPPPSVARLSASLVLALVLVAAGCAPDNPLTPAGHLAEARLDRLQIPPAPGARLSIDDEYARLADEVPGFGGIYFDASGVPVVQMKTSGVSAEVRERVSELLLRGSNGNAVRAAQVAGQVANLRVARARYDFRELYDWYHDRVTPVAFTVPGVVMTDIDERRNRIVIGVRDASYLDQARARFTELGLSPDAYEVTESPFGAVEPPASTQNGGDCDPMTAILECPEPPTGSGGDTTSLRATRRPIIGGLQIAYSQAQLTYQCSAGFNIVRSENGSVSPERYFVTNSHCGVMGEMTGMSMGQSTPNENVANEVADPVFVGGAAEPMCPPGRACRFSDASLFQYYSASSAQHGASAFPALGYVNVGDVRAIVGEGDPVVGMVVNRIGRTTGRSVGTVEQTCVNMVVWSGTFDTGRTLLCQSRATYSSESGDSGGPVVEVLPDGSLVARGIHWRNNGGFSPMNVMLAELRAVTGGVLSAIISSAP